MLPEADPKTRQEGRNGMTNGGSAERRPTISISDLKNLPEWNGRPTPLTVDEVNDFAVTGLTVLRGLGRRDKLRVLARMRRILG